jgi:hypothetical protein
VYRTSRTLRRRLDDHAMSATCSSGPRGRSCQPLTQVQQAVALNPTAVIIDIGNNDILGAVTSGQLPTILSSPASFVAGFNKSYGALLNTLAATKATLVAVLRNN